MNIFKKITISCLAISVFIIPGCETEEEPNRPAELVGMWSMNDADGLLTMTSNTSQKGANMFAKGISGIQVSGNVNDELVYMIVNLGNDEEEDGPDVVLSNQSFWDMDEEGGNFPVLIGSIEEDDSSGQKIMGLMVMANESQTDLYMGISDYVLDSLNFNLSISADTLYQMNMSTGGVDSSSFYIADGTFQAATFSVNANDSVSVDFPLIVQGMMEEQISMELKENGDAIHYFTDDEGEGQDHGEWWVTDENILVMAMEVDGEGDTLAFPYSATGSTLTLMMKHDVCDFFEDFFNDENNGVMNKLKSTDHCFDPIEQMFLLQENSVTDASLNANLYFIKAIAN